MSALKCYECGGNRKVNPYTNICRECQEHYEREERERAQAEIDARDKAYRIEQLIELLQEEEIKAIIRGIR